MSSRLIVDRGSQLQEFRDTSHQPENAVIQFLAKLISYVFHPLFVPVYIAWFLITVQPYLFVSFTPAQKILTILRFVIMYSFFPLITVLLAKALGFLDSVFLKTQKERVIPYIACGVYYFWMCYVLRNQPQFSKEVVLLSMAIFLASSIGLLVNIYMKVSMHAISMGILLMFMSILSFTQSGNYSIYLSLAILIAGVVCTARFIVSDHTPAEIYTGLLVGIVSQLLAIGADKILP
ncbi:MAG TPA: hypothetical protein PLV32_12615 [Chitinophagaceae bacterium]|nr:hypothetical protein [Chitinophagaceae bacterium]